METDYISEKNKVTYTSYALHHKEKAGNKYGYNCLQTKYYAHKPDINLTISWIKRIKLNVTVMHLDQSPFSVHIPLLKMDPAPEEYMNTRNLYI